MRTTFPGRVVRAIDRSMARHFLASRRERPALLAIMFHHVFATRRELENGHVDPYQPVLVKDLEHFVAYFLGSDYRFVSPAEVLSGLDTGGHFVLLTFDDGYASSLRAIPVLRQFGVPATFFVTVDPVVRGETFWWDAVYREMKSRGESDRNIRRRQVHLKRLHPHDIESSLVREFGPHVLRPTGDDDRPLTSSELCKLSAEELVTIGNHTANHALLALHDDSEVHAQIARGQDELTRLTGAAPQIIAYPDGSYDQRVIAIAKSLGLRLGVTTREHKNRLPLTGDSAMELGRFSAPSGPEILSECAVLRSDRQLRRQLQRLRDETFRPRRARTAMT